MGMEHNVPGHGIETQPRHTAAGSKYSATNWPTLIVTITIHGMFQKGPSTKSKRCTPWSEDFAVPCVLTRHRLPGSVASTERGSYMNAKWTQACFQQAEYCCHPHEKNVPFGEVLGLVCFPQKKAKNTLIPWSYLENSGLCTRLWPGLCTIEHKLDPFAPLYVFDSWSYLISLCCFL